MNRPLYDIIILSIAIIVVGFLFQLCRFLYLKFLIFCANKNEAIAEIVNSPIEMAQNNDNNQLEINNPDCTLQTTKQNVSTTDNSFNTNKNLAKSDEKNSDSRKDSKDEDINSAEQNKIEKESVVIVSYEVKTPCKFEKFQTRTYESDNETNKSPDIEFNTESNEIDRKSHFAFNNGQVQKKVQSEHKRDDQDGFELPRPCDSEEFEDSFVLPDIDDVELEVDIEHTKNTKVSGLN